MISNTLLVSVLFLVISVLESAETQIQKELDTEGDGETPEADDGFCKMLHLH